MGCDIHMKVERRVNGKWDRVDGCTPYHERNYTVFSVLADVRNDGNVTPIAEARGLPADAVRSEPSPDEDGYDASAYEYGDHSFSWLTLDEVLAYPWRSEMRDEGWVDAETFAKWNAGGAKSRPSGWCKSVSGKLVNHVTNSDMRRYIADGMTEHPLIERLAGGKRSFYTLIQWTDVLADRCKSFLDFVDSLAPLGEPRDIRLVFGFDS